MAAGQLDRRVELLAQALDPADADARAEARGLDPERQAHRLAALAPARLAGGDELDLRQARLGEESLQRQLVHADRRGEDVGADVGEVEPLEQALDAAVLAEGAVQGGEGGVGAEQAGRRAPARPARRRKLQPPSREIVTRSASWPASSSPPATASPERSETSCSEERPPPRTATLILRPLPVRLVPPAGLPTTTVTVGARFDFGARRRELVGDAADLRGDFGFLFLHGRLQPGFAQRFHRFGAFACRSRSGTVAFSSPLETTIETVEPRGSCEPALGAWRITSPAGLRAFFFFDAGGEAAAADLLHRDRALRADQDRHLGQLRPAWRP